jgi:hypothetical protein
MPIGSDNFATTRVGPHSGQFVSGRDRLLPGGDVSGPNIGGLGFQGQPSSPDFGDRNLRQGLPFL